MPIHTITTDVSLSITLRAVDERGDVAGVQQSQSGLSAVTPLAALELYEHLQAARNEVRRKVALAELPMADEGLLTLAFLRSVAERRAQGAELNLSTYGVVMDQVIECVQMNRLDEIDLPENEKPAMREYFRRRRQEALNGQEEATAGEPPRHFARCPKCKQHPLAMEFKIEECEGVNYSPCPFCGETTPTYLWDPEGRWKPQIAPPITDEDVRAALAPSPNSGQEPAEVT